MEFSFVHASDLRMDVCFRGLRRFGATQAAEHRSTAVNAERLRDASLLAFDALVDLTIERQAAFLLLAGGIGGEGGLSLRGRVRLFRGLRRLAEKKVETFVVLDAHEANADWAAELAELPLVTVFGPERERAAAGAHRNALVATIQGRSRMDRAAEDPLAGFERGPEPGVHIGLLRGSYDDAALSACGLDYWALGGTLERRIARQESPWIVSPGSVCGRSFRRDERGPRGATVVHVAGGKVAGVDFAPLAPVELVVLEARASDVLPALESGQPGGGTARDAWIGAVCDRLERQLVDLDSPEAPLVLVRAVLSGQFAGSHRLGRSAEEEHRSAEEVLEQLRARAARAQIADGARARTLWWDSIEVDLWPDLDREELLRRGDLAADLVRIAAGYGEDERALAAELERRAAPLRKRELGRLLRPLEEKGRLKLLRRAEREAHRLLEQEEVV